MALKQCPECKREISDKAKRCPHRAFQQPRNVADTLFSTFLILVLLSIVGVAIMVVVQTQKTNRAAAEFHSIADPALAAYGRVYSSPTPTRATTPSLRFVTLRQSVSINGTVLPVGTRLRLVALEDPADVRVQYAGGEYAIPISATDLK